MSSKGPKHLLCFKLSILISDFSDFQHIMPRDRYRRRSTSEEEHDEPQQQYEEEHDGSQQYEEDSDDTSADQADQVDESSDDDDGGSKNGAELASYYGKFGRVDEKEVTLKLNKETLALFFRKIPGKGEFDRDGVVTGGDWPMGGIGWQVLTQGINEGRRQYSSVHIHKSSLFTLQVQN